MEGSVLCPHRRGLHVDVGQGCPVTQDLHGHNNPEWENLWVPQNKARTRVWDSSSAPRSWAVSVTADAVQLPGWTESLGCEQLGPSHRAVLSARGITAPARAQYAWHPSLLRTHRLRDSRNPCLLGSRHHSFRIWNLLRHGDVVRNVLQDLQLQIP